MLSENKQYRNIYSFIFCPILALVLPLPMSNQKTFSFPKKNGFLLYPRTSYVPFLGQNVHQNSGVEAICPPSKIWGKMSWGILSFGAKHLGAKCLLAVNFI